jgi:hypothetical protein
MKKYYWTGISREDRTKTLHELTQVISRFGTVINFLRYSDIALGITIEIEENNVAEFYFQLQGLMEMDGFTSPAGESNNEVFVLMNISFLTGTGDLEIGNAQPAD